MLAVRPYMPKLMYGLLTDFSLLFLINILDNTRIFCLICKHEISEFSYSQPLLVNFMNRTNQLVLAIRIVPSLY